MRDVEAAIGTFQDQNLVFNFQAPSSPLLFGQGSQTGNPFLGPPVTTYSPPLSTNYPLYSLNFPSYASTQNQFTVNDFRARKDLYLLDLWPYDDGSAGSTEPQMVTRPKKGNNPNGRKGRYRCETCRKDRKKVIPFKISGDSEFMVSVNIIGQLLRVSFALRRAWNNFVS